MRPFPSNFTGPGMQVDSFPRGPAPTSVSSPQPPPPFNPYDVSRSGSFDVLPINNGVRSLLQSIQHQMRPIFGLRNSLQGYLRDMGGMRGGRGLGFLGGSPMGGMGGYGRPEIEPVRGQLGLGSLPSATGEGMAQQAYDARPMNTGVV